MGAAHNLAKLFILEYIKNLDRVPSTLQTAVTRRDHIVGHASPPYWGMFAKDDVNAIQPA